MAIWIFELIFGAHTDKTVFPIFFANSFFNFMHHVPFYSASLLSRFAKEARSSVSEKLLEAALGALLGTCEPARKPMRFGIYARTDMRAKLKPISGRIAGSDPGLGFLLAGYDFALLVTTHNPNVLYNL